LETVDVFDFGGLCQVVRLYGPEGVVKNYFFSFSFFDKLGEFFDFSDAYLISAVRISDLFHLACNGVACRFCEMSKLVKG